MDFNGFLSSQNLRKDALREPNDDTVIWKYLDLAKYLALLRTCRLHLAPATEFWDRYEGDIGIVQKKALVRKFGEDRYNEMMSLFQTLRERTFVSCWTENEFESDAMWRIYTGANYGVAIRSSYGRLKALLPEADPHLLRFAGRVNYVDFRTDILDLDSCCLPYFYKRRSFEHEREVRVILQDVTGLDRKNESSNRASTEGSSEKANGKESADREKPGSRQIGFNKEQLADLILSVHLSPGAPAWFKDLVREVNQDYGLDRDPQPSSLDEEPP